MTSPFKVGDRVRLKGVGQCSRQYGAKPGAMATIIGVYGVTWDEGPLRASQGDGVYPLCDFELVIQFSPLDPNRPVRTRAGNRAYITMKADPSDAPTVFRAKVWPKPSIDDFGWMILSFDKYGCFIPGQENPVDLVNI